MQFLDSQATAMAREAGFTEADVYSHVLIQAQEDNPMALIGGYSIDRLIVGAWLALRDEEYAGRPLDDSEMRYRINQVIEAGYAGIV